MSKPDPAVAAEPPAILPLACVLAIAAAIAVAVLAGSCRAHRPYAIARRPCSPPYLSMPHQAGGPMPQRLSLTGAFIDTANLVPAPGLIPYDVITPLWSDGAMKQRWLSVPDGPRGAPTIGFSVDDAWRFPPGTVFVKLFELVDPASGNVHRLETRLLVRTRDGGVYGVTYHWRPDGRDADLLPRGLDEVIPSQAGGPPVHWHYPSREECLTCHTAAAGFVLGVTTRQLNRTMRYPSGIEDNEIRTFNHIGLFARSLDEAAIPRLPHLAALNDGSQSLADRVRSYLDANCAQCHRPGGTSFAGFDARYRTPLADQRIVDTPVIIDHGIDDARYMAPGDPWRSMILHRMQALDQLRMPPVGRNRVDEAAVAVFKAWIWSLPGPRALPPPRLAPVAGRYGQPQSVTISCADPQAEIHYTTDGSLPDIHDPRYRGPIVIDRPATMLRAVAVAPGRASSIAVFALYQITPSKPASHAAAAHPGVQAP